MQIIKLTFFNKNYENYKILYGIAYKDKNIKNIVTTVLRLLVRSQMYEILISKAINKYNNM